MKKENEIGKNFSSGAEKVERIEKTTTEGVNSYTGTPFEQTNEQMTIETQPAMQDPVSATESAKVKKLHELRAEKERKEEKERLAAERRVQAAMKKQERKEKAKREKEEAKRRAEVKRRRQKEQNDGNRNNRNNKRAPSISGWIAAVAVLGATTLGLGAVVTVGAIDMKETKQGVTNAYRGNLYELTGLIENVDEDLDRIRVSASETQQARILTDLLVQARLAESVLEKLPIDAQSDGNVTAFINRTAALSERLLAKLRAGESLDEKDEETLEHLYEVNHQVRGLLGGLIGELQDEDVMDYLKGKGEDKMTEAIRNIENATIEENKNPSFSKPPEVRAGAAPKDDKSEKISSSRAEELCRSYFADYEIKSIEFDGETTARSFAAYNFKMQDVNDVEIFAQISEKDGALISFDYYEYCTEHNFDLDNAKMIAENFLDSLGMENMTAVKVGQMGATASITFAYEMDGAVYYPDTVEVKVCEQKGVVVGYNGAAYLRNHKERTPLAPKLSLAQAQAKLHDKLQIEGSRVALIAVKGREKTAYEFICSYKDQTYFVYLDGNTGEEISIINSMDFIR